MATALIVDDLLPSQKVGFWARIDSYNAAGALITSAMSSGPSGVLGEFKDINVPVAAGTTYQLFSAPVPAGPWTLENATYFPLPVDPTAAHLAGVETFTGVKTFSAQLRESSAAPITAFSGGGQASATPLPAMFNRVGTSVATVVPFDSVLLPASVLGLDIVVVNATNNPIQVFGTGADTINGAAAATGVTIPPNAVEVFFCSLAGQWQYDPGIGFSGQLFTELAQDNITARAGGGQALATQLWAQTSKVTIVATAGDSVKLPASAPGLELMVINAGAKDRKSVV